MTKVNQCRKLTLDGHETIEEHELEFDDGIKPKLIPSTYFKSGFFIRMGLRCKHCKMYISADVPLDTFFIARPNLENFLDWNGGMNFVNGEWDNGLFYKRRLKKEKREEREAFMDDLGFTPFMDGWSEALEEWDENNITDSDYVYFYYDGFIIEENTQSIDGGKTWTELE